MFLAWKQRPIVQVEHKERVDLRDELKLMDKHYNIYNHINSCWAGWLAEGSGLLVEHTAQWRAFSLSDPSICHISFKPWRVLHLKMQMRWTFTRALLLPQSRAWAMPCLFRKLPALSHISDLFELLISSLLLSTLYISVFHVRLQSNHNWHVWWWLSSVNYAVAALSLCYSLAISAHSCDKWQ